MVPDDGENAMSRIEKTQAWKSYPYLTLSRLMALPYWVVISYGREWQKGDIWQDRAREYMQGQSEHRQRAFRKHLGKIEGCTILGRMGCPRIEQRLNQWGDCIACGALHYDLCEWGQRKIPHDERKR